MNSSFLAARRLYGGFVLGLSGGPSIADRFGLLAAGLMLAAGLDTAGLDAAGSCAAG